MHGINLYAKHGHVCEVDLLCREKNAPSTTPLALQDLIEKVMLLKKAVEKERKFIPHLAALMLVENLETTAVYWLLKDALIQPWATSDMILLIR